MSYKTILTQRNATRNQSTADYTRENPFLFGNRYVIDAILNNNTGDDLVAKAGILVCRDTANPTKVIPAAYDLVPDPDVNTLGDVIGILSTEGEVVVADGEDLNGTYCISGDIDAGLLVLPDGVTLNTVVGNKILKDVLTDLGFVLKNVTENSKFDN